MGMSRIIFMIILFCFNVSAVEIDWDDIDVFQAYDLSFPTPSLSNTTSPDFITVYGDILNLNTFKGNLQSYEFNDTSYNDYIISGRFKYLIGANTSDAGLAFILFSTHGDNLSTNKYLAVESISSINFTVYTSNGFRVCDNGVNYDKTTPLNNHWYNYKIHVYNATNPRVLFKLWETGPEPEYFLNCSIFGANRPRFGGFGIGGINSDIDFIEMDILGIEYTAPSDTTSLSGQLSFFDIALEIVLLFLFVGSVFVYFKFLDNRGLGIVMIFYMIFYSLRITALNTIFGMLILFFVGVILWSNSRQSQAI